jgi:ankyrin repeat protein
MGTVKRAKDIYCMKPGNKELVPDSGLCFGLAMSAINEHLHGNLNEWLDIHSFILKYKRPHMGLAVLAAEEKRKEYYQQGLSKKDIDKKLGKENRQLLQVKPFYDDVLLNMSGASSVKELFPEDTHINQSYYTTTDLYEERLWSVTSNKTRYDDKSSFISLLKELESNNDTNTAYALRFKNHIIGLIRDENKNWVVINHDNIYKGKDLDKVWTNISEHFVAEGKIIFGISCFSNTNENNLDKITPQNFDKMEREQLSHTLSIAIKTNDINSIENIINLYPEILHNEKSDKTTPLLMAIMHSDISIVEFLISRGVDINQGYLGSYPFEMALYLNRLDVAELLIRNNVHIPKFRQGVYSHAILKKNKEFLNILISNNIDSHQVVQEVVSQGSVNDLQKLYEKGMKFDVDSLTESISKNNIEKTQFILDHMGDIDVLSSGELGYTPLEVAMYQENINIITIILIHISNKYNEETVKISLQNQLGLALDEDIVLLLNEFIQNPKEAAEKYTIQIEKQLHHNDIIEPDELDLSIDNRTAFEKNIIPAIMALTFFIAVIAVTLLFPELVTAELIALALTAVALIYVAINFIQDLGDEELNIYRDLGVKSSSDELKKPSKNQSNFLSFFHNKAPEKSPEQKQKND